MGVRGWGRTVARMCLLGVGAVGLSACETLIDIDTHSSFFSPASAGSTPVGAQTVLITGEVTDSRGGGVQYYLTRGAAGLFGYAGVLAGSEVGDAVTTGQATYLADYEVATMTDLRRNGSTVVGFAGTDSGVILLSADFGDATLSGEDGNLAVIGEISGDDLTGSVVYAGQEGALQGAIGTFGTIGAFHGNSGTIVYSGGFVGARP